MIKGQTTVKTTKLIWKRTKQSFYKWKDIMNNRFKIAKEKWTNERKELKNLPKVHHKEKKSEKYDGYLEIERTQTQYISGNTKGTE